MRKLLVIDNYDSFTYNLVAYCAELGKELIDIAVYYNDQISIDDIKKINPNLILLSPGPGSPKDSGICLDIIKNFYKTKPILGVCLGHQCLAYYFGANIIKANKVMHGKNIDIIVNSNSRLFNNLDNKFSVTRYHSLIIENTSLSKDFDITAYCLDSNNNQEIMAIEHKQYNLFGVQFHPEAVLTQCGHEIIKNFLYGC